MLDAQTDTERSAAMRLIDQQIAKTDQYIARLRERQHRAVCRRAGYVVERGELLAALAMPRHFHAQPPHLGDLYMPPVFERSIDLSTSQLNPGASEN